MVKKNAGAERARLCSLQAQMLAVTVVFPSKNGAGDTRNGLRMAIQGDISIDLLLFRNNKTPEMASPIWVA
jgi:hypothetical protein